MDKETREQKDNPLQIEVKEYGGVSRELIELATTGIIQVLKRLQVPQSKPLRVHVTEGGFQTLAGVGFIGKTSI